MWTWKLSLESTQKKTRKKRGRRGGALWFSPAQSRQEVSSGHFQPKGSEVQWRCCQSVLTYQLKKGRGFHQHWLVVQSLVLWVSFDYGALFSPQHTEKAHGKDKNNPASCITLCHLLPAFPQNSLANNILFLYRFTLTWLGITQAKIIFKS